jgi:hypothetical protein
MVVMIVFSDHTLVAIGNGIAARIFVSRRDRSRQRCIALQVFESKRILSAISARSSQ